MDYATFKKMASELTDLDLHHYKSQQMDRRINSLMQFWNIPTYDEYLHVLKTNPQKYKEFVKKLTINVSEFFRNPERFEDLRLRVLPELLEKQKTIRIWSAGCSNGAEAYSIAIILREMRAIGRATIYATDVDREILEKAKHADYSPNEIKNMTQEMLETYFQHRDGRYYLCEPIKRLVSFSYHNLLTDPFEKDWDLIICRNVVIYFTESAKEVLYQKFLNVLNPGGYLMVGGTEPLLHYHQMGLVNHYISFYQKK